MWLNPEANLNALHIPALHTPPLQKYPLLLKMAGTWHHRPPRGSTVGQMKDNKSELFPAGYQITFKVLWQFLEWNYKNVSDRTFLLVINYFTVMVDGT